jgi:predicted TIM-barrel fold metal-dependent hydrolase
MTDEREAWLGLTQEEAIEPDVLICDPHHHLWDYPGSRYLVDELARDISGGHRIASTLFVECRQFYRSDGPEQLQPVGETEFVDRVAGRVQVASGPIDIAAGIVGFADLTLGTGAQAVLEAHMNASGRFRGVRHATAWDESDQIHNAHTHPPRGLLGDRTFRAGLACVENLGLSFDAWLYHPQILELVELARAMPGLNIVLDHMAGPLGIGPYAGHREEVFEAWSGNMAELATCGNVSVKLGGLTMSMSGFGWHRRPAPPGSQELAEVMGPYFRTCIEYFGVDRCMFESNFPVDRASCSYTVLWNAFKRLSRDYSDAERSALFHDTAAKVYRLEA